jgi:hypothetical protein
MLAEKYYEDPFRGRRRAAKLRRKPATAAKRVRNYAQAATKE